MPPSPNRRWLACLLASWALAAAASERGSPIVQVYDSQELGAAHINTDVAQLPDGRLVVANMQGLLRFDGVRWEEALHPKQLGGMEHLAVTPDGRAFTSFNGDVGWFADDAAGRLQWHSQLGQLPDAKSVGEVIDLSRDEPRAGTWYTTPQRVLFVPDAANEPARTVQPPARVLFGHRVDGDYWLQLAGDALQRIDTAHGDALVPIPGGELVQGHKLWAVAEGKDDVRLATSSGRLLRWRDGALSLWSDAPRALYAADEPGLRDLLRLRDGRYVVASIGQGPVVLDDAGNVVDRYGSDDGVPGQRRTHGLFQDRDGDVWLAQDRSIVKLGLARAVTVFDERRGLPSANAAMRWHGELYVTSPVGLFRLHDGDSGAGVEHVLPQLGDIRGGAVLDDDTLLLAANGVIAVTRGADGSLASHMALPVKNASALETSRFVRGRAWAAHGGGVMRIERDAGGAIVGTPLAGLDTAYYRVAEQDERTLWVADRVDGVMRVTIDGSTPPRRYGVEQGLPAGQVRIYSGADRVWFTTMLGLRVYDAASDRFVVPANLPPSLQSDRLYSAYEDAQHNLWVRGGAIMNDVFWREGDGWRMDGQLMHQVPPNPTIFGFLREGDIVWAIRATGLLRFDLAANGPAPAAPAPLLTRVRDLRAKREVDRAALPVGDSARRDLRFEFALPVLQRPEATQYRSRLVGYDHDWSEWSNTEQGTRIYTNLPDGEFRFEVQARDAQNRFAELPAQRVAVPPPWWRSTVARIGYGAVALCALWLAAHCGARRRQRQWLAQRRELETQVAARTRELQLSNAQLAEQAQRLAEVDQLKTRFFVNVGHEFRTPLTLVLGPIEDLLRDARERFSGRAREQLEMAGRNARRVLDLVVELLDVNRFEHGQMRLHRVPLNLATLAERVLAELAPLLERHGHRGEFRRIEQGDCRVFGDPLQIERALGNLIGNAAKFMPRGGSVTVAVERDGERLALSVRDEGRGIEASALPHVFDRFYQSESGDRGGGHGIGLALVREIAEAHDGEVTVESTPGVGSCFRIVLPAASCGDDAAPLSAPAATAGNAAAPAAATSAADTDEARSRPLVLVVDDHDDLRLRLRHLLADKYDVIEAADGPGAWQLARDRLPDLIVCDVMMPGFDGVTLARRLRADADTDAIALLLLTAKAGSEHAAAGLAAGADDYLAKPFDAAELMARLDALLARAQRLRLRLAREQAPAADVAPIAEDADARFRRRLDAAIAQHLDDPAFGVEQLAAALHVDRSQLFRRCRELLAASPSEVLRDARLKRAHHMLETAVGNVSEIAYANGFDSLSSFTRAFRARYGLPPSHVRLHKTG